MSFLERLEFSFPFPDVSSHSPLHHHNIRFQVGGGGESRLGFESLLFYGEYSHAVIEIHKEVASGSEERFGENEVVILCHLGL